jgi:hypothetical protein
MACVTLGAVTGETGASGEDADAEVRLAALSPAARRTAAHKRATAVRFMIVFLCSACSEITEQ